MPILYKIVQYVTDIGKPSLLDDIKGKRIILINWISVLLILLCITLIPFYILDYISFKEANGFGVSFLAFFSLMAIISNYLHKYLMSKILISFAVGFFIFVFPLITSFIFEGIFLWYPFGAVIFSILPFLLFDIKKGWLPLIISGLFYLTIVMYGDDLLLMSANKDLDLSFIYDSYLFYKGPQIFFWAFLNLVVIILMLTHKYTRQKLENAYLKIREKSKKIKEQSDEINAQNEELKSQGDQLNHINATLEQRIALRTEKLEYQNKMLSKYAYMNAHLLRGPLCTVMGLINLLKWVDDEKELKDIFDKLQQSANKLDNVIKKINDVVEKGNQLTEDDFMKIQGNEVSE